MAGHDQELPATSTHESAGESGQGLAEYALILAFVAIAAVAALRALGGAIGASEGFRLFDLI
jgi:hypothetical protein